MSDSFRPTPQQPWAGSNAANGHHAGHDADGDSPSEGTGIGEPGKALLVGVLGGLLSAAGYMIYCRLPEEQKEKLNAQVRSLVAQRITEFRQNFNI